MAALRELMRLPHDQLSRYKPTTVAEVCAHKIVQRAVEGDSKALGQILRELRSDDDGELDDERPRHRAGAHDEDIPRIIRRLTPCDDAEFAARRVKTAEIFAEAAARGEGTRLDNGLSYETAAKVVDTLSPHFQAHADRLFHGVRAVDVLNGTIDAALAANGATQNA